MLYCQPVVDITAKNKKILIVEDSKFMNDNILQALQTEKLFTLKQAFTFTEALERLSEETYDFVILDLNLPDAYGEDLVNEMKRATNAKIIILTAEDDKQIRESLFKSGILDYIVKDKKFSKSLKHISPIIHAIEENALSNILLLEDSLFMSKQLQKILNIRNYKTFPALNAADGFKVIQEESINLIILDMELPDKHGLEVLSEIKENENYCHIPIIVISGDDNPEIVRECLKHGASNFIKKPFNIEEFTLKVDLEIINNRRRIAMLCEQQMLNEYKIAIDDSTIVSKTDPKGIITYVNQKFCDIAGYTKEELIGKPHNIVRHPDNPSSIYKEMWNTIQNKQPWHGILKNIKKDGSEYIVQSTINPIVNYTGEIIEYIGIRTDITELETYKNMLKSQLDISNHNLEYVSQYEEAINKYVAVVKTDKNNIITYVNNNFCDLSGYTKEELIGTKGDLLHASKHLESECDKISNKLKKNEAVQTLFENIHKNGNSYFVDTEIFPLTNHNHEVIEHLCLMYDVTDIVNLHKELENTQKEIIYKMGEVGESRSEETGNHVKRVAEYSKLLAQLAGLGEKNANLLYTASPMHDIGKVAIPDNILKKPGKLDDNERKIMEKHSEIGFQILKSSNRPILRAAAIVSYMHHEKWNGTGYPQGIKGDKIHIFGRITAIADVFDALGSDRYYKKAWKLEDIIKLLEREKGAHFDPKLIDLFLNNLDQFLTIRDKFQD